MLNMGFLGFGVFVFAITGLLLLLEDVRGYKHAGLNKERKIAKILGWINLSLGVLITAASWIVQYLFW